MAIKTAKIGFYDSGNGGLQILQAVRKKLPQYDYLFLADNKNLPYGNKTQAKLRQLVIKNLEELFHNNCRLVIIACNTASAKALRHIQKHWLPKKFPDRKVLGVIVPTLEVLKPSMFPALLIATKSTVTSNAYKKELRKLFPNAKLFQKAIPNLAELIEHNKLSEAEKLVAKSINPYQSQIKSLILGCTHYSVLGKFLKKAFPKLIIINQVEIIPTALAKYLTHHHEMKTQLTRNFTLKQIYTKKARLPR